MIVKVDILHDRAFVSTKDPKGKVKTFEASATRLRSRFAERPRDGRLVGYFEARIATLGESKLPEVAPSPVIADVFEIGERVDPKEGERW